MSSSSDNVDRLKKLMKLKRHEQPPPRFSNEFSRQVIARLQAGETETRTSWWEMFGFEFGLKPALGGALAILAGGFLIYGIIASMNMPERVNTPGDEPTGAFLNTGLATPPAGLPAESTELTAGSGSSTNPILNPDSTLGGALRLQVKPVSFTPQN